MTGKENKDSNNNKDSKMPYYNDSKLSKDEKSSKDGRYLAVQPDLTCIDIMEPLELFITGSNDSIVRLYDMRENGLHLAK